MAGHHCKGCGTRLMLPPDQPCPICNKVNKPNKKINRYNYNDGFYGQPSQAPAYADYYFPPLQAPPQAPEYADYYNPQSQVLSPPPPVYSDSYYFPQPQVSPPPTVYDVDYYSPQRVAPSPTVYSDRYDHPRLQVLPTQMMYGYDYPQQQLSPPLEHTRPYKKTPQAYKKRAVLCGVTYKGHRQTLEGSVNNVRSMHQLLMTLGFPSASIRILTEEESDPNSNPTKRNIEMALQWLVKGCQSGDSLVFYYAGHGSRVPDESGDEIDGYDEALCPVDYRDAGKILDDEINATIVAPLPHGVKLHCVIDTCFSGTLLDLPFLCRINRDGFYKWEDHRLRHTSTYQGTRGGKAICISACDDHQNSGDTSAFTGNPIGALTYSFIEAFKTGRKLKYGCLLKAMRKVISETQKEQGRNAPFASSASQEPQLSSSTRFEIYSEPFML